MVSLPVDFSAITGTITGADHHANYTALNAGLTSLRNANFAADAAIDPTKLSNPFAPFAERIPIVLGHHGSGGGIDYVVPSTASHYAALPNAPALLYRTRIRCPANGVRYLVCAEIYTGRRNSTIPRVQLYKNGTLIAGATFDLTSDNDTLVLERGAFRTNPVEVFVDGDYLEVWLGNNGTAAQLAHSWLTLEWKERLSR
jgi:hypothetical protein